MQRLTIPTLVADPPRRPRRRLLSAGRRSSCLLVICRRSRPTELSERRVEVAELGGAHTPQRGAAFGPVGHLLSDIVYPCGFAPARHVVAHLSIRHRRRIRPPPLPVHRFHHRCHHRFHARSRWWRARSSSVGTAGGSSMCVLQINSLHLDARGGGGGVCSGGVAVGGSSHGVLPGLRVSEEGNLGVAQRGIEAPLAPRSKQESEKHAAA